MNKIIDFLIKRRYWILAFFFILAIVNVFLLRYITINYDISSYLGDNSSTKISLETMNSEFESSGSFQIMVDDISLEHAKEIKQTIEEIENIKQVLFDEKDNYKDGHALYNVYLKCSNFDVTTREAVNTTKEKLKDEKISLTGGAIDSLYLGDSVNEDMIKILLTALIVVFIILIINSVSWIEPIVFMIVIGVAIIINLGSNALLPSISFVTGSICAVMQLALAMDYSIMLLHRYINEKENNHNISNYDATKNALRKSLMPILSSGLTTIAGLISLVFMNFKIGFDIGLVLSKGILVSLIVVIVFMPGLLMVFSNLINKTKHRNLYQIIREKFPKMEHSIARYQYKSRFVATILLGVLIVIGFVFYLRADYKYTLEASTDENSVINVDRRHIEEIFGIQNTAAILLPKNEPDREKEVVLKLESYTYNGAHPFKDIQSLYASGLKDSYTSSELSIKYDLPEDLIKEVYKQIDDTRNTFTIKEVINYLNDSSFIIDYTDDLQNEFDDLYEMSLILNEQVDGEKLARLLTNYTNIEFSKDNANALINKVGSTLTFKEFVIKISEDDFFTTLYNDYQKYVRTSEELEATKTKEEVKIIFSLNDETLDAIYGANSKVLLKDVIINIDRNALSEEEKNVYDYYLSVQNTKDIEHTKEEVKTLEDYCYNIIPSIAYVPVFLLSNKSTNYQIQKTLVALLQTKIEEASSTLAKASFLVTLVDKELNVNEVATAFDLSESFIFPIYNDLNKTALTGKELLAYVKDNEYIKNLGGKLKEMFGETNETIDYAFTVFESTNYRRIIFNLTYSRSSQEAIELTRILKTEFSDYYDTYYVVSECGGFVDFEDTFAGDSIKISIASLCFILLIISISFKSIAIPIILTLIIQGAIWITLAISVWTNWNVYFICYLMIVCIQMGTTIDYGILYTSKYLEERKTKDIESSIVNAFRGSITTILTSGIIIVVASFLVGVISKVSIISSIGYLLSVGTMVSLIFIIFALPQVLVVFEKFINATTFKSKNNK